MSFGEAISSVLANYANFQGRARRREYWFWILGVVLAELVVLGVMYGVSQTLGVILYVALVLAVIVPTLAVAIRRLHDTDRSGWWVLLGLVPLANLVLIVFYLLEGTPGANRYGPSPKAVTA